MNKNDSINNVNKLLKSSLSRNNDNNDNDNDNDNDNFNDNNDNFNNDNNDNDNFNDNNDNDNDNDNFNDNNNNNDNNDNDISNITDKSNKFMSKLNELEEMFSDSNQVDDDKSSLQQFQESGLIDRNKSSIIRITSQIFNKPEFNGDRIKTHNKNGLTIVVPNIEGDFFTNNYEPMLGIELGCQFIAMNFQYINEAMDTYITKFEKKGIIPLNEL